MSNKGFGLVVRFHLKPGAAEGFDQLVAETVPEIGKHEPGTLTYTVHGVEGEPNQRIFYELYADRAAFDAHEEQPHTRHFLAERGQYLSSYDVDFIAPTVSNTDV
jgi:quinol monooxygenase YgiN